MTIGEAIELMKRRNSELVVRQKGHSDYTRRTDEVISALLQAERDLARLRQIEKFCRLVGITTEMIEKFSDTLIDLLIDDRQKQYDYMVNATIYDLMDIAELVNIRKNIYDSMSDEMAEKTAINDIYKEYHLRNCKHFTKKHCKTNADGVPLISKKDFENLCLNLPKK